MKKNQLLVLTATTLSFVTMPLVAETTVIQNLDDGNGPQIKVVTKAEWPNLAHPAVSPPLRFPLFGGEHVLIASLCASASTNLNQSYVNTRAGTWGVVVSTNRAVNPAAWYLPPTNGWQWFDLVSTSFHSWMGSAVLSVGQTANEYGHRNVIHEMGLYPVSAYTLTISSSLTNIGTVSFNVATNTATKAEISFNSNFVGINYGPNGIDESFYDPSSGVIVVGGDDTVITSGLPSQSTYSAWWRFGSTVSVSVGSTADFNPIIDQFAGSSQWMTATLSSNNVVVDSETITAAQPKLSIVNLDRNPTTHCQITVNGGQLNVGYRLLTWTDVGYRPFSSWEQGYPDTFFSGTPIEYTNNAPNRFFVIQTVAP